MIELTILLNSVNRVKQFVQIVNEYPFNVDLVKDHYIVDGKSIMGIFSLNLKDPITLKIRTEPSPEADALRAALEPFIDQS